MVILSLDDIAWTQGTARRTLEDSVALLDEFVGEHEHWIIEACYGVLLEGALAHCEELSFLNAGIEAGVAHCRERPWEPGKFAGPEEQQAYLDDLVAWVRSYETRDDEYGLAHHRKLYEGFAGPKREYVRAGDYADR